MSFDNRKDASKAILTVQDLLVTRGDKKVLQNISFTLFEQEQLVIVGSSGSGKSTLGLALAGKIYFTGSIHFDNPTLLTIAFVEQQHNFKNRVNTSDLYYQQRYNSFDSEETLTVKEYLMAQENAILKINEWGIESILSKTLIQLSNGENKKLQLAKVLANAPDVLILDQPFIGLDIEARSKLHTILDQLRLQGKLIILITSPFELPQYPFKLIYLEKGIYKQYSIEKICALFQIQSGNKISISAHLIQNDEIFDTAIRMQNVSITYGENHVLQNINWHVKKGEKWQLKGHNGAGKSTLLSLITGDNPQAYANDIYLFDRKRGSGESIWEIKNRIGYLSPELHLFYEKDTKVFNAIASGFFDSIGLFRKLTETQKNTTQAWVEYFELESLAQKYLYEISLGQQRMVLLIRAFVKNPSLLILDEPCQGLDEESKKKIIQIVDETCTKGNKTLIYVSHYQSECPACIQKTIEIENGKVDWVE